MSTQHLRNITLNKFRIFLQQQGCHLTRTNRGHEHWTRNDLLRPITIQTHINPIPEFIVKNILGQLGLNKKQFFELYNKM